MPGRLLGAARPGKGEFVLHPGRTVIVWHAAQRPHARPTTYTPTKAPTPLWPGTWSSMATLSSHPNGPTPILADDVSQRRGQLRIGPEQHQPCRGPPADGRQRRREHLRRRSRGHAQAGQVDQGPAPRRSAPSTPRWSPTLPSVATAAPTTRVRTSRRRGGPPRPPGEHASTARRRARPGPPGVGRFAGVRRRAAPPRATSWAEGADHDGARITREGRRVPVAPLGQPLRARARRRSVAHAESSWASTRSARACSSRISQP
jgi:hypothetical protein